MGLPAGRKRRAARFVGGNSVNENENILELTSIGKKFPGVTALDDVSFELRRGEIHAICGENGAGKSTLLKILSGAYVEYDGNIRLKGKDIRFKSTMDARLEGVSVIPQEIQMAEHLTVYENIFMGNFPTTKAGFVDRKEMLRKTREYQSLFGETALSIPADALAGSLSMGKRQIVEIIKAISMNVEILALDEPTSSLSKDEIRQLFQLIHRFVEQGISVIYVSHKLDEIFEICDRVTVLKDGKKIGTVNTAESSMPEVINMMVGRNFELYGERNIVQPDTEETVLEVRGLSRAGEFNDISFKLRKGEILGAFGIIGSGRTETAKAIFGLTSPNSGEIYVRGQLIPRMTPEKALGLGMGFITEDRHGEGLALILTIRENLSMPILDKISKNGILNLQEEISVVKEYIEKLEIKTPTINFEANNLSGGNQQKVVVAKWLAAKIDILIIDEPTRGIDVKTKSEMYRLIRELSREGVSVFLISSELPEILGLCHRIMVFRDGGLAKTVLNTPELTEAEILTEAVLNTEVKYYAS